MAEQENLAWYEYDEAEQQIAVLQMHINSAVEDLNTHDLTSFSRNAILNEIERHMHFIDDIKEQMNGVEDVEPANILGVEDE